MQERQLSNGELYALYLQYRRDFMEDNPEVPFYPPPSFEGFEFTMQRLDAHPVEKNELLRHWKQGWRATYAEMSRAYDDMFIRVGGINASLDVIRREMEKIFWKYNSYSKFI